MIYLKHINIRRIVVIFAAVFLSSCASVDEKEAVTEETDKTVVTAEEESQQESTDNPESLIEQGKPAEAAMNYLKIASKTPAPERYSLKLKAIDLLISTANFDIAQNLIETLNQTELNTGQLLHYAFLNAKVAVHNRNPEQSLKWLSLLSNTEQTAFATPADRLKLLIKTYEMAGKTLKAVTTRVKLETYLSEETESLKNQQAIIQGLTAIDNEKLKNLAQTETSTDTRQWINLALLIQSIKNPFRLGNQLDIWKSQHPGHALSTNLIASLAPREQDQPPKLDNIALILPITGPFRKPAKAIRDGFIASYYAQSTSESKPTIRIYDTGKSDSNVLTLYQKAIDDGADVIVGPLRKNAIKTIAMNTSHPIPTLVLNQLEDQNFYSRNFYQFALSPEAEAKQTARRAWFDGHNNAAVIYPKSKWGKRVSTAFIEEWETLGGKVTSQSPYKAKKSDFSKPIKALLAIDKSYERRKNLSRLIKTRLKFEPRRREDIDFVFMAAFPKQARLIPPQLKFFHAADLPIYSTSHAFTGKINRKKDRDLDNVTIGDTPWTLTKSKSSHYKLQVYRTWPRGTKKFNRLYALGTDAYNILFYLNWLRSNNNATLQGTTGKLHMNQNNQMVRQLSWAKFTRGKPKLQSNATMNNH